MTPGEFAPLMDHRPHIEVMEGYDWAAVVTMELPTVAAAQPHTGGRGAMNVIKQLV